MSVVSWPGHLLTLDDWVALPEEESVRLEVAEGVLIVSPRPVSLHQRAVTRLGYLIDEQLPDELSALADVEIVIEQRPLTVRAPDVLVSSSELVGSNPARYYPDDVRLVIEVLSEGSVRTDRVMKFSEYADAGIEHYWIVDLAEPVSMIRFRLIQGAYEQFGEHTGRVEVDLGGASITIDLDALTANRAQRSD